MSEEKYNTIMDETDDRVLCVKIHKPISKEGYENNFLPRIRDMVEKTGEIRLLVFYEDYKGWEEEASALDMQTSVAYRDKLARFALVNPPEKEMFQKKIKSFFMSGEFRNFAAEDFGEALDWVRE